MRIYLAKSEIVDYADTTEPKKYPHLYQAFVPETQPQASESAGEFPEADFDKWLMDFRKNGVTPNMDDAARWAFEKGRASLPENIKNKLMAELVDDYVNNCSVPHTKRDEPAWAYDQRAIEWTIDKIFQKLNKRG